MVVVSPASVGNEDEKKQRRPRTSVTMMMVMIIITQKFLVYKNFEDELQAN